MRSKRRVCTVDAETDPFLHGRTPKPFLWGFYDGEKFYKFEKLTWLVRAMETNNLEVYAHNGGKFDFLLGLFEYARPGEIRIINGRLAEWRLGSSVLKDSYLMFPQALDTFDKGEIDYALFEEGIREKHMPKILKYLERDCRSLHTIVTDRHETFGKSLTLATSCMQYWEKMQEMKAPRSTAGYYENFSRFYYGGRVECFQKGVFNFKKTAPLESFDIVSAYPYAMTFDQPWGMNPLALSRWPKEGEYGRTMLTVTGPSVGALPSRKPKGGLWFPHDGETRTFDITGWEWAALCKTGQSYGYSLDRAYIFDQSMNFREYVDHFFDLKRKAPKGSTMRQFAKLMLNSLYGKWAANPKKYRKYEIHPCGSPAPEGFRICDRSYPWDFFDRPLKEEEQRFFDVAVGAGITGFERAKLYLETVKQFGKRFWENPNLFYMDTDNLKGVGMKFVESSDLGGWEKEYTAKSASFAGKKLYEMESLDGDHLVRSKGVRLSWQEIRRVAQGETVHWKSESPSLSVRTGSKFLTRDVKMT